MLAHVSSRRIGRIAQQILLHLQVVVVVRRLLFCLSHMRNHWLRGCRLFSRLRWSLDLYMLLELVIITPSPQAL